jgi:hypothetical protein
MARAARSRPSAKRSAEYPPTMASRHSSGDTVWPRVSICDRRSVASRRTPASQSRAARDHGPSQSRPASKHPSPSIQSAGVTRIFCSHHCFRRLSTVSPLIPPERRWRVEPGERRLTRDVNRCQRSATFARVRVRREPKRRPERRCRRRRLGFEPRATTPAPLFSQPCTLRGRSDTPTTWTAGLRSDPGRPSTSEI